MKIDKAIEYLKLYKKTFGNIELKIPKYLEVETVSAYHKELLLEDCYFSVIDANLKGKPNPVLLVRAIK